MIDPPACRSADLVGLSLNGGCALTLAEGGISDLCRGLCGLCPSFSPTATPTASPTAGPTAGPTSAPTASPSAAPSSAPSASPTAYPTMAPTNSIKGELHCGDLVTGDTRISSGTLNGVTPSLELPFGAKWAMPGQTNVVRGDCYVMYAGGTFPPQGGQMTPVSGSSRVFHPSSMFGMPSECVEGNDCVGALVCPKPPLPGSTEPQQPYGINSAAFQAGTVVPASGARATVYFPVFSIGFQLLPGVQNPSAAYVDACRVRLQATLDALLGVIGLADAPTTARVVACQQLPTPAGGFGMTRSLSCGVHVSYESGHNADAATIFG